MQLVLEKRAERSNTIALVSPLIAIGMTIVTMSILFAILGKNPILRAWRLLHRSADRQLFAAGNRGQGDAARDDRDRAVALLSRQRLEHRRRRTVPDRRRRRQLDRGENPRHRRRPLGVARDAGAGAAAGALYALIPAICKVKFGASEILTSLMLVYVADLFLDYWCAVPGAIRPGSIFRPPRSSIRSQPCRF